MQQKYVSLKLKIAQNIFSLKNIYLKSQQIRKHIILVYN
jgi:hypothetical protein